MKMPKKSSLVWPVACGGIGLIVLIGSLRLSCAATRVPDGKDSTGGLARECSPASPVGAGPVRSGEGVPRPFRPPQRYEVNDRLLDAIHKVENPNDDPRPGPAGERGPLQITEDYWTDAVDWGVRHHGAVRSEWDYLDGVYDWAKSCQIVRWYMARFEARSDVEVAILHNQGPRGLVYWRKIERAMR